MKCKTYQHLSKKKSIALSDTETAKSDTDSINILNNKTINIKYQPQQQEHQPQECKYQLAQHQQPQQPQQQLHLPFRKAKLQIRLIHV